jgi:hypothetical protein
VTTEVRSRPCSGRARPWPEAVLLPGAPYLDSEMWAFALRANPPRSVQAGPHIVRTTRNSAFPLIICAKASAAFQADRFRS